MPCDRVNITSGDLVIYAEINDYCVEHDLRAREMRIEPRTLVLSCLSVSLRKEGKHGVTDTVLVSTADEVAFEEPCAVSELIEEALVEWEWDNNPVDWDNEIAEREADDRLHMMREEGL